MINTRVLVFVSFSHSDILPHSLHREITKSFIEKIFVPLKKVLKHTTFELPPYKETKTKT